MRLFHATDQSCVDSILKEGFLPKRSKYHWLGNGVYFYRDFELAKWWATNPTNKFGVDIVRPIILSVDIDFDQKAILDLTSLTGYINCISWYNEFSSYAIPVLEEGEKHDRSVLRCSFFDWIFLSKNMNCIIGNFTHKNQNYLKKYPQDVIEQLRLFDLPFTETQICIRVGIIGKDDIKVEGC